MRFSRRPVENTGLLRMTDWVDELNLFIPLPLDNGRFSHHSVLITESHHTIKANFY
jgi:hypothetical protein